MNYTKHILTVIVALAMSSCIPGSHIPPTYLADVLALEVAGQGGEVQIDVVKHTITVPLAETTDISVVEIVDIEFAEGATGDVKAGEVLDLSTPHTMRVDTEFSHIDWQIVARQQTLRRFEVVGQVGNASFTDDRYVLAYVTSDVDMTAVEITALKLGPVDAVMKVDGVEINFPSTWDFSWEGPGKGVVSVEVSYLYGATPRVETWKLSLAVSNVALEKVDPFARRVYVEAFGQVGNTENYFEYRNASQDGEWVSVVAEKSGEGGFFGGYVKGLEPETDYEVRAVSNGEESETIAVRTHGTRALLGVGFEDWHTGKDGTVNPWAAGAELFVDRWWDSGNTGAKLKENNTTPDVGYVGKGVRMESISVFENQNLAAGGNMFVGKFAGVSGGTNGKCDIGLPWYNTTGGYAYKPTGLRGHFKYAPRPINMVSPNHVGLHPFGFSREKWLGSPDSLHICIALWADPEGRNIPFTVDTDPSNFVDFEVWDEGVLAYGSFVSPEPQSEWAEFNVDMDYFETGALPANTYLYVLLTASKSCNYFIAGAKTYVGGDAAKPKDPGSILWVDELELLYE